MVQQNFTLTMKTNARRIIQLFDHALEATRIFNMICHYFPIRGHSFLKYDRDFGVLKQVLEDVTRVHFRRILGNNLILQKYLLFWIFVPNW